MIVSHPLDVLRRFRSQKGTSGHLVAAFVYTASAIVPMTAAPAGAQRPPAYRVGPVQSGATLGGRATFVGDVPRIKRFMITKDVEVCGMGYREREEVEISEDGGLHNVVVFIEGIDRGKPWPERNERYVLSQEHCTFTPHVQVIPRGEELDILNPDPVLHNIHGFEAIGTAWRTMFNFGQPPERETITHAIRPRRGSQIRLECDAHDFMLGWIYAAETPYATMVGPGGRFEIDEIPPGTYTVTAWHPYLGIRQQEVILEPGTDTKVTFEFSAP